MSYSRRFLAIALAALGLFVVSYGIGLGNPGLIAVGVAVGVLGPALLVFTAVRATGRQYIYGTAHVYSASPPPSAGMVGRCELHLSVFAAGIDGVAVRVLDPAVPVSKWPDDGATLPVEVVANNPRKVRVLWDKVVTHAQAAGEDLYPQYVEDLPSDPDDDFVDDLPADEYLDEDLPPVPAGPPPTPPPNMPTASPTVASAGMSFAPVSAPVLVPPAAAPSPGAPTTKVVTTTATSAPVEAVGESGSASTPSRDDARSQGPERGHTGVPGGAFGPDVRAERDRRNRAFVSETYDPDDDETPEYWRDPDDSDDSDEPEARPATTAPSAQRVARSGPPGSDDAPPVSDEPDAPRAAGWASRRGDSDDSDDSHDSHDSSDPGTPAAGRDSGAPVAGRDSRDPVAGHDDAADADDTGDADDPGRPDGTDRRDGSDGPDGPDDSRGWGGSAGSGAPAAAEAGGPAVSLPLPRRRPSPHLRRPSPRQRKASDSETNEPRAAASGGINPVYVAETPTEPPPDWPLSPHPQPDAQPVRPESRPEPDYTEVVSGTVEPGSNGYGEVLTGSIVDDHAYSDRSESDRMTFDRGSFRVLEVDLPPTSTAVSTGSNGFGPARTDSETGSDPESDPEPDPFNVVPLRVDRAGASASNGASPRTDGPSAADDPDEDPADDPDDSPADTEGFAAEGGTFLAAPSAGLSSLGSGGFSVTLFVRELARSSAFYRDVLGLAEVDTGKNSAVLARGESRILLKRVTDLQPVDRRVVHLNLEVPDVQAAYEDLKAKGVDFVHRPRVVSHGEQLELWAATFRDPDGHAIALTHWEIRH
jgi:catechol 2,3-dioxygenase-like lactoylglutathione lyase family enzyme